LTSGAGTTREATAGQLGMQENDLQKHEDENNDMMNSGTSSKNKNAHQLVVSKKTAAANSHQHQGTSY
ncbi:unnamed protein product, partial [Amoebophrya sp. A120]